MRPAWIVDVTSGIVIRATRVHGSLDQLGGRTELHAGDGATDPARARW